MKPLLTSHRSRTRLRVCPPPQVQDDAQAWAMSRQAAHKAITASLVNIEADMDHATINRFEAVAARQRNKTDGILNSMRGR